MHALSGLHTANTPECEARLIELLSYAEKGNKHHVVLFHRTDLACAGTHVTYYEYCCYHDHCHHHYHYCYYFYYQQCL